MPAPGAVEHFGQQYEHQNCEACDVCLQEIELMPDALVIAQKILSCVARVEQRFGADYVANVLIGSRDQRILDNQHHELSTYGLLNEFRKSTIRNWMDQLIDQDCLLREPEHQTLRLTALSREIFHGEHTPLLLRATPKSEQVPTDKQRKKLKRTDLAPQELELFERLRNLRREIASEKGMPPFVVFGDVTLIDLARKRPRTETEFLEIHGVGQTKADHYAEPFLAEIAQFDSEHDFPANE